MIYKRNRCTSIHYNVWTRLLFLAILLNACHSFTPPTSSTTTYPFNLQSLHRGVSHQRLRLWAQQQQPLPNLDSMKATELRKELESYGISTKSFFEKNELVDALKKARDEGKTPIDVVNKDSKSSSTSSSSSSTREKRLEVEIAKCQSMKIGELKKELETLGIATNTFFEKSEFVRALAEARVDGVQRKTVVDGGASGGSSKSVGGKKKTEEMYDPSYRDVIMQKLNMDPRDMRMGPVIDVRLAK